VAVQIRSYGGSDLDAVVRLSLLAWEPVFESIENVLGSTIFRRLHPDWRSDQRRAVEGVLGTEGTKVWVAEVGDHVAGFIAVDANQQRQLGEVVMIAVDPACQNDGIGARLTSFALEWLSKAGMTVAMVETGGDPGHAPARRLYEKAGFTLLPIARYFKAI
jgi:ribosomal protein S18 acetylase RimI-like enzyme